MKVIKEVNFLFLRFFLDFSSLLFQRMKSTMNFFSSVETRLVGVTKNGKDTPEHCCRSEVMDRENAPK